MDEACKVCQHAKVESLRAMLRAGRPAGLVAHYFRLAKIDLINHLKHDLLLKSDETPVHTNASAQTLTMTYTAAKPHVVSYPEFEVSVQLDDDTLGAANFQRQRFNCCLADWKVLNRDYRAKFLEQIRAFEQDALYEV